MFPGEDGEILDFLRQWLGWGSRDAPMLCKPGSGGESEAEKVESTNGSFCGGVEKERRDDLGRHNWREYISLNY